MTLHDLFEEIETLEFSLNLSVLSGFKSVLFTLDNDDTFQRLTTTLKESHAHGDAVFQRLLKVLSNHAQPDTILFSDEAVTAYLYALHQVDAELATQAAGQIAEMPGLFWARRLAKHILETPIADPK